MTTVPNPIRVLLIDDHPLVRQGIVNAFNDVPDIQIIDQAGDANEALACTQRNLPDVMVTDLTLPGKSGLDLIKESRAIHPTLPILVLSMHDEKIYGERVIRLGALGYVTKDQAPTTLVEAIRTVAAGRLYVSPVLAHSMIEALTSPTPRRDRAGVEALTDREFTVFEMLGRGLSAKEMAHTLGLSSKTVDVHRANIRTKLNIPTSNDLVRFAVRWLESRDRGDS